METVPGRGALEKVIIRRWELEGSQIANMEYRYGGKRMCRDAICIH
jgi:hypothetical protein